MYFAKTDTEKQGHLLRVEFSLVMIMNGMLTGTPSQKMVSASTAIFQGSQKGQKGQISSLLTA